MNWKKLAGIILAITTIGGICIGIGTYVKQTNDLIGGIMLAIVSFAVLNIIGLIPKAPTGGDEDPN